jgi:AraC family transcriptional regulator
LARKDRKADQAGEGRAVYPGGMTEIDFAWQDRIARARQLLEARLDEELSLDELAQATAYSVFHFHRLFRAATGETVRQYSRRLRLERAAHRLTVGQDDILPIAIDAGYNSHEAFTRAFVARFDTTPSAFRAARREVHQLRITPMQQIEVRIEQRQPVRIAFVRNVGPYSTSGEAWGKLMKWGWTKMMFKPPETFGLGYDDPDVTPAEQCRYDACMVIKDKTKVKPPVETKDFPGGAYVVTLHAGPFNEISSTYAKLFARVASGPIEGKSWTLGDPPSLEKYLKDPRKTKPEDMLTEVWMPVFPA